MFPIIVIPSITLNDFVSGELGFPRSGGNKQEHAGAHASHVWWCPAPDLHVNAKRLVPTLHELPCLQKPPQERLGAMPRILKSLWSHSNSPFPHLHFGFLFFSLCGVCLKGPYSGSSQGFSTLEICTWTRHSGLQVTGILNQCLKSPEGSIPQVLLQINIARSSKGLSAHFHISKTKLFIWIVFITFFFYFEVDVMPSPGLFTVYTWDIFMNLWYIFSCLRIFQEKGTMGNIGDVLSSRQYR